MPLVDIFAMLDIKGLSRKGFYIDKETAEKMVSDMGRESHKLATPGRNDVQVIDPMA